MGAGSAAVVGILLFVLMLYAMYKFKLPFAVQVPIGLFVLFVFAGAGIRDAVVGGLTQFTVLMWIGVMAVGAMTALVIWRLRR